MKDVGLPLEKLYSHAAAPYYVPMIRRISFREKYRIGLSGLAVVFALLFSPHKAFSQG
jgi:hypothetical protein